MPKNIKNAFDSGKFSQLKVQKNTKTVDISQLINKQKQFRILSVA
jgi:hypothetical protein